MKGAPSVRKVPLEELRKRAEEIVEKFKKHIDVKSYKLMNLS